MSDDVAFLFADEIARPDAGTRRVVFMSAMSLPQMQQYATAGWEVVTGPGFQAAGDLDLAAVPATRGDEDQTIGADLLSFEAPTWPSDAATYLRRWTPAAIKVNAAFHSVDDGKCNAIAAVLKSLGYELVAAHWRDDNSHRLRSLGRIDRLAAFGLPDWKYLNLIAVRGPALVRTLLSVGRLYTGEEKRIAELRLNHAVRGGHIAQLEDAMMALQSRVIDR